MYSQQQAQLDAKAFHRPVDMPQSKVDICADSLHCLQPNVAAQIFCICPTWRQTKPIANIHTPNTIYSNK